ncbi:GAF and ANTAR domain-containing protein [Cellulomonas iranensis]|uniref:GAF and ANTAR domain-containing protein n=1 Tax=Cellulomonas iranensis TaxID=76862 RepID=UPI0013D44C03|nr:GAF and ANTAR domain-containing protein [Cellulomonas iranensis]
MLDQPLGDTLGRLHDAVREATDVQAVVDTVAASARATLPGVAEVSVTLRRDGDARTVGATGERARRCDEVEYAGDAGPCLTAADEGRTVLVRDVETDGRWPAWALAARAEGFVGAAAFPVATRADVSVSLNVYSERHLEWQDSAVVLGERYAAGVAHVLGWSVRLVDLAQTTADLRASLESRAVIDQAIGIVMAQNRVGPDEALRLLRQASQGRNVKLRDLARDVVVAVGGSEPESVFVPRR